jgi:hypothetical protein
MATVRCVGVIRSTREAFNLAYGHIPLRATQEQKDAALASCRAQLEGALPPIVGANDRVFDMTHDDAKTRHWVNLTVGGALACRVAPG